MEVVILQDMPGSFLSQWVRLANTSGHDRIQIGDRFREQGFGDGCEELEVDGVDFSPIGGASRLHVIRAAHATRTEIHRAGCVFEQTYPVQSVRQQSPENGSQAISVSNQPANGSAAQESGPTDAGTTEPLVSPKRGRGRPPGSKNKPKPPLRVPAWPGMP